MLGECDEQTSPTYEVANFLHVRRKTKVRVTDIGPFFVDLILDEANGVLDAFIFLFCRFCSFHKLLVIRIGALVPELQAFYNHII